MAIRFMYAAACTLYAVIIMAGCNGWSNDTEEQFLIRIGEGSTSVADYNKALEIAKTAYPHSVLNDPEEYKNVKTRLLKQLIEELILQERARELNIAVTEAELEHSISKIKADYPGNEFEQTLLEYAVPYKAWKEGIRNRMLMEKLVEAELHDKITITPADIARYYEEHIKDAQQQPGIDNRPRELDEKIIRHLRRQKIEAAYKAWIEDLQKRYTIDINQELWQKLLVSQG